MKFIKKNKISQAKESYFYSLLDQFWFIPSDVLLRATEASIWDKCIFTSPILDIGVGDGEISNFLFRNKQKIDVGIDVDNHGLEKARLSGKYKKIVCADASKMPFKNAKFGTVVSNSTFEHIRRDVAAVGEVSRVLKKDGLLFLTVPSNFLERWILLEELSSTKARKKLKAFNKRASHFHYRSLSEWKKVFHNNNLELIYYQYYFSKKTAILWYRLFTFFTYKIYNREFWSYLVHSSVSKFIPVRIIIFFEKILLLPFYKNVFIDSNDGGMIFMVAKKIG